MQRDLVELAIAGDREAYTQLVGQSIDRSYALALLILRDPDRARDATQDAYVAAWRSLSSLREPDAIEGWLRRLVVRACTRELDRERRRRGATVREIDVVDREDPATLLMDRDQLERGFRRLPADQRTVLVLRYYLDLPLAEVADAMAVPLGTVKSRLNRATRAMRAALEADARPTVLAEGRP